MLVLVRARGCRRPAGCVCVARGRREARAPVSCVTEISSIFVHDPRTAGAESRFGRSRPREVNSCVQVKITVSTSLVMY